jgi:hypothetical protein
MLKKALQGVKDDYGIIIDCAPWAAALNALTAA